MMYSNSKIQFFVQASFWKIFAQKSKKTAYQQSFAKFRDGFIKLFNNYITRIGDIPDLNNVANNTQGLIIS